jgi:diacylglycerol kinase (ATP)
VKKQVKSFSYAFYGVWTALKTEGHLRFHFVAAVYVIIFSFLYKLSAEKFAVVSLIIAGVIGAELFNTALERLCDTVTAEYDKNIKFVKDLSAAAVLVFAAAAVAVAFLFYFDLKKISEIAGNIIGTSPLLILFILSIIISVVFIAAGPIGIKKFFNKLFHR